MEKQKHHDLKSWSSFFLAIKRGDKTHDLRINDRDFQVGDTATLHEYAPDRGKYTGDRVKVKITFITSSQYPCAFSSAVLPKDYAILSLKVITE